MSQHSVSLMSHVLLLLSFGRTRPRRRRIHCPSPAARSNRATPARQYQQPDARQDQWGVPLAVTIARRLARPPRRGPTGHHRARRRAPAALRGCCGLPACTSSGSRRRPTPWRSVPEQGGLCALWWQRASEQGHQHGHTLLPPSKRGHRHSPAPTTGCHSARRKVTNFLLIPPRAPLFRPPSSWGIALMAFSPGRVCRERAESTHMCGENTQSLHGESASEGVHGACRESVGALHRESKRGACRRAHGLCTQGAWGQARGCAASVHTVCKEDAQSTQENMWSPWREHTWSVQLRLHRVCTERVWSVQSVHGTCMVLVSVPALGVCSKCAQSVQRQSMQRAPVQSVHGACAVSTHTAFVWDMHTTCGECAKSVSKEGVCNACMKHTQSVHGVHGKQLSVLRVCKSEPAVLAQGIRGACSECAKGVCAVLAQSVCGDCGESEHKAAEHAWSVHMHTGSTHTAHPATMRAHVCVRARCPHTVAQPPMHGAGHALPHKLAQGCNMHQAV